MFGKRIDTLNITLDSIIKNFEIINPDVGILVNVLQFSSDCHWMYDAPVNIESFWWIPIKANGLTNFWDACRELNNAMSKDKLFSYNNIYSGYIPSVIFLITDGAPTDEYISNM